MTKFVIIGVVVLGIAGVALFQFIRGQANSDQSEPGFREFVKDPALWDEMIDANEESAIAAENADSWGSDQLAKQVEQYVFSPETKRELWALGRQLRELSPKTNDVLIGILNDKSNAERLLELRPGDLLEEAPVMRVCELFDGNMPPEAIQLITPYVSHDSDQVRKDCILAIAESGLPELCPRSFVHCLITTSMFGRMH